MKLKKLWKQILQIVEPKVKRMDFLTFFKSTALLELDDGVLVVGIPSPFSYDTFIKKFHDNILEAAKDLDSSIEEVKYEIRTSLASPDDQRTVDIKKVNSEKSKVVRKVNKTREVKLIEGISSKCLDAKYTLENFIVGPQNRLSHAACMAVSGNLGGYYNPLFIYGGVGLGKTHLLQATGNEALENNSENIVVYTTSERFVNEIVAAIKRGKSDEFRRRYRRVDCLIIDDIQFLAGKNTTQNEFFHTFNELYDASKQIIISADRPPSELKGLEDRLVSRFEMGMIVDVQMPDYETRLAILQTKCQEAGVIIAPDVLDFVAENVGHSIRELEGVLRQIIAQVQLEEIVPTVNSVASIFQKLNQKKEIKGVPEHTAITVTAPEDVIDLVAGYYKVTVADLIGSARKREFMIPRQVAMYLIRQELRQSLERIGELFGGRNHTTVIHSCDKVRAQIKKRSSLIREINAIKREMGL